MFAVIAKIKLNITQLTHNYYFNTSTSKLFSTNASFSFSFSFNKSLIFASTSLNNEIS